MSGRISTFGGSAQLGYQLQSMQSQMTTLTSEIASGEKANPTAALGTGAALLYQLQMQADQQNELQTSIGMASSRLDIAQTVMSNIGTTVQDMSNAALGIDTPGSENDNSYTVLAQQAQDALGEVLGQLNTGYAGSSIFAGDSAQSPMQSSGAAGGPLATMQSVLSSAVTAAGGPLTAANVNSLVSGSNGIASVFSDTNSNSALNYTSSYYVGSTDSKSTSVLIGNNQTLTYNASANQQGFRDVLQGLSMLSMLDAPSNQMDDTAKNALLTQAMTVLSNGQTEVTSLQGGLGAVQSQMSDAINQQQSAATATQVQINNYEQADTYGDSTKLTALQTQIQATYELTSQISQLSMVHYMPAL